MKIGDTVQIMGETSFAHDYKTIIVDKVTRYDTMTGKPYSVIITKEGCAFHGKTGASLSPRTMYYMEVD